MQETPRNQWPIPAWNAEWLAWQEKFNDLMSDVDSTVFANTENLKVVFKSIPNASVVDDAGTPKLVMTGDLTLVSRTLNTSITVDGSTDLVLQAGYMIGAVLTPGAVGPQDTVFELFSSVEIDPSIQVFGYVDEAFTINWFNGSTFEQGDPARQLFSFKSTAGGGDTYRVMTTGADTTPDYLSSKLVAGAGVTFTVQNPGANENILIDSTGTGYWQRVGTVLSPLNAGDSVEVTIPDGGNVSPLTLTQNDDTNDGHVLELVQNASGGDWYSDEAYSIYMRGSGGSSDGFVIFANGDFVIGNSVATGDVRSRLASRSEGAGNDATVDIAAQTNSSGSAQSDIRLFSNDSDGGYRNAEMVATVEVSGGYDAGYASGSHSSGYGYASMWAEIDEGPRNYIQVQSKTPVAYNENIVMLSETGIAVTGTYMDIHSTLLTDDNNSVGWISDGIALSATSAEWDNVKALLGGAEGSIFGAILAASITGGSTYWERSGVVLSPLTDGDIVQVGAGTVGAPGYAFEADPDTGMYLVTDGELGLSVGGASVFEAAGGVAATNRLNATGSSTANMRTHAERTSNQYVTLDQYLSSSLTQFAMSSWNEDGTTPVYGSINLRSASAENASFTLESRANGTGLASANMTARYAAASNYSSVDMTAQSGQDSTVSLDAVGNSADGAVINVDSRSNGSGVSQTFMRSYCDTGTADVRTLAERTAAQYVQLDTYVSNSLTQFTLNSWNEDDTTPAYGSINLRSGGAQNSALGITSRVNGTGAASSYMTSRVGASGKYSTVDLYAEEGTNTTAKLEASMPFTVTTEKAIATVRAYSQSTEAEVYIKADSGIGNIFFEAGLGGTDGGVYLSDQAMVGSSITGPINIGADAIAEWNVWDTNFGEVSYVDAMNQLYTLISGAAFWQRTGTAIHPQTAGDTVYTGVGSASQPSYSFESNTNSGMWYNTASGRVTFTLGGQDVFNYSELAGIAGAINVAGLRNFAIDHTLSTGTSRPQLTLQAYGTGTTDGGKIVVWARSADDSSNASQVEIKAEGGNSFCTIDSISAGATRSSETRVTSKSEDLNAYLNMYSRSESAGAGTSIIRLYATHVGAGDATVNIYGDTSLGTGDTYLYMGSNAGSNLVDYVYFSDANRLGSTWSSAGVRLSAGSSEWDAMEVLGSGEVSLFALISAAAASGPGGSLDLDGAYNNGSSITVDTAAVTMTTPDASGNSVLVLTQNDNTNDSDALVINQNASTTNWYGGAYAIYLSGSATHGQVIASNQDMVIGTYKTSAANRLDIICQTATTGNSVFNIESIGSGLQGSTLTHSSYCPGGEGGGYAYNIVESELAAEGDVDAIVQLKSYVTAGTVYTFEVRLREANYVNIETVDFGAALITNIASACFQSTPDTASWTTGTGTLVVDFDDNIFQTVSIDANVTTFTLITPSGMMRGSLRVTNTDSSAHTVVSPSSSEFWGDDDGGFSIAAGETVKMIFEYYGSSVGWDISVMRAA